MPETFESLIDAQIDAKLAALQAAMVQGHNTQMLRIDAIETRLAALEPKPVPVPTPPTIKQRLTVRDGRFLLDGEPFQNHMSVNVAGNAIVSTTRTERRDIFKRLQDVGCQLVRLHHVAKDDRAPDRISEYQPTYDECRAAFPILHECLVDLADMGMGAWMNLQHRQRIDEATADKLGVRETLFGPRPSGIRQGEIHDTFFWFSSVRELVLDWMAEQTRELGAYPSLWMATPVNEKLCIGADGYAMNERETRGTSQYGRAWFEAMDLYRDEFSKSEREMDKAELLKFQSRLGCQFFRMAYEVVQRTTTAAVGSTPLFGDRTMSALPEISCNDFTDLHIYPSSVSELPDPFLPNDVRTIQSIANACRVVGKPLCLSEYAGIHEGQKVRLPSFYPCLDAVARAGFDVSCYYAWNLGKPGNNGLFDAGDDAEFVRWFHDTASEAMESPTGQPRQLSTEDLFGFKALGTYQPPAIPGTQPWAKEGGLSGVLLPELGWM